jgi:hypothetical protein
MNRTETSPEQVFQARSSVDVATGFSPAHPSAAPRPPRNTTDSRGANKPLDKHSTSPEQAFQPRIVRQTIRWRTPSLWPTGSANRTANKTMNRHSTGHEQALQPRTPHATTHPHPPRISAMDPTRPSPRRWTSVRLAAHIASGFKSRRRTCASVIPPIGRDKLAPVRERWRVRAKPSPGTKVNAIRRHGWASLTKRGKPGAGARHGIGAGRGGSGGCVTEGDRGRSGWSRPSGRNPGGKGNRAPGGGRGVRAPHRSVDAR